jgi:hypothetical protein
MECQVFTLCTRSTDLHLSRGADTSSIVQTTLLLRALTRGGKRPSVLLVALLYPPGRPPSMQHNQKTPTLRTVRRATDGLLGGLSASKHRNTVQPYVRGTQGRRTQYLYHLSPTRARAYARSPQPPQVLCILHWAVGSR